MKKNLTFLLLLLIIPVKVFALIEVDITRGNLNPLPLAVSPLSIDEQSRKEFQKIIKKENIGSEISNIVENNLKIATPKIHYFIQLYIILLYRFYVTYTKKI